MSDIVYIAGTGRSGSTLLDMLLSSHPLAFGAGELSAVFVEWAEGGLCTCGESYPQCAVWGGVIDRLKEALPDLGPAEAERVTRRIEAMGGSRARQADRDLYRELWRTLIEAIRLESGKQVIVDSSKSSRASTNRILSLAGLAGFDMHVIHLVRDPRALMWSALRGSNRLMEAGKQGTLRGGIFRMLVGWSLANLSVHMSRRANPSIKVIRIRYEDLVSQPVEELKRLGEFLGLDFSTTIDSLVNQRPLDPGHGVKGNRMRRQGPVHIRGDEEWKTALPRHARVLAMLSWPLARLYGYDVLHDAA